METIKLKNQELARVIEIAKQNKYRVFAFQKNQPISQILIVSQSDKIGTISASYDGVSYGTIHKPCHKFGTGFGLSGYMASAPASLNMIKSCCEIVKPEWAGSGEVKKYKNWEDYVNTPINRVLTYFEI